MATTQRSKTLDMVLRVLAALPLCYRGCIILNIRPCHYTILFLCFTARINLVVNLNIGSTTLLFTFIHSGDIRLTTLRRPKLFWIGLGSLMSQSLSIANRRIVSTFGLRFNMLLKLRPY